MNQSESMGEGARIYVPCWSCGETVELPRDGGDAPCTGCGTVLPGPAARLEGATAG